MGVTLHVAGSPGEVRAVAVQGTTLLDVAIWRPGRPDGVGDLHRGRVSARMPALAGTFVALGGGETGFLPDSEGGGGLGEGDRVGLRVTRAAQGGKGPRVTARLSPDEAALAGAVADGLAQRGPGPVARLLALHADADVLLDDPGLAARLRPALGGRGRVSAEAMPGWVADALAALASPEVALPGGLRASIHPTPALVAIDVDGAAASGARRGKAGAQRDANLAALPALARQLRLRNLSGAILIDLAGMAMRRRAALGPALAAALAEDPLAPRLLGFTALGLAEIVRPRVHPPLHELLAGPHAAGLLALRRLAAELAARPGARLGLAVAPDVAAALAADPVALPELAQRCGVVVAPRSDPALAPGLWRIEAPVPA